MLLMYHIALFLSFSYFIGFACVLKTLYAFLSDPVMIIRLFPCVLCITFHIGHFFRTVSADKPRNHLTKQPLLKSFIKSR
uniref:Uncharacterized protein n=1 Tax=Brassica oleracea var. oleracea TaxID=109376 RepID=A0A0D3A7I3_BRAOL